MSATWIGWSNKHSITLMAILCARRPEILNWMNQLNKKDVKLQIAGQYGQSNRPIRGALQHPRDAWGRWDGCCSQRSNKHFHPNIVRMLSLEIFKILLA
jgi:hypothetical protein